MAQNNINGQKRTIKMTIIGYLFVGEILNHISLFENEIL